MKPEAVNKRRVLVVDNFPLLRDGISELLNRQDDLVVCGEADCVKSADEAVARLRPHLLLLDLRLGNDDTIEFIKSLRARIPELRFLVFTQYEETLYAERALRAGVDGYVLKTEAATEFVTAVRAVLSGECYVSRRIASHLFRRRLQPCADPGDGGGVGKLSDRELHVFQLLGSGLTTRAIAQELNLSIKTIETYRNHIKNKLCLHNGSQLVLEATRWVHRHVPTCQPPYVDGVA
jgi:DNA-binding NarL/FixJ family response regulator